MTRLRKILAAIEPWYDWGMWSDGSMKDGRIGNGWRFQLEWFGFQIFIAFTRFPKES